MAILAFIIIVGNDSKAQYIDFLSMTGSSGYPGDTVYATIFSNSQLGTIDLYIQGHVSDSLEIAGYNFENTVLDTSVWNYYFEFNGNFFLAYFYLDSIIWYNIDAGPLWNLECYINTANITGLRPVYIYHASVADTLGFAFFDTALTYIEILNLPWARGDLDHNDIFDIDDIRIIKEYIYENQVCTTPIGIGDINCDNLVDIVDILLLRELIFFNIRRYR
jgi:hypothetical protein